jgi:dual oxidase
MADCQYLTEKEIGQFLDDLDKNNNGFIEYDEIEHKLDEVHREIALEVKPHHIHYQDEDEAEQRYTFLWSVMGTDRNRIPRQEFVGIVKGWKIPSMDPDKKVEEDHKGYMRSMSWGRRLRAYWSVRGPEIMFITLVVSMQIAFGAWQLVKYVTEEQYRHVSSPIQFDHLFSG